VTSRHIVFSGNLFVQVSCGWSQGYFAIKNDETDFSQPPFDPDIINDFVIMLCAMKNKPAFPESRADARSKEENIHG